MTFITKMCLLRSHYIFKDRIQHVGDTTIDCSQNLVLKRFNKTTKLPISFHLLFHNNIPKKYEEAIELYFTTKMLLTFEIEKKSSGTNEVTQVLLKILFFIF